MKVHASTGAALTCGRRAVQGKTHPQIHALDIRASYAHLRCGSCVGSFSDVHGV